LVADPSGRLVFHNLVAGGLAATAGLREGDTIISVDGRFLTETDSFHEYLASHPGQPVRLIVLRDGAEQTIRLQPVAPQARDAEIRPALGVRFVQGAQVILSEVVTGSPADLAGLRPGDHIVAVDGEVVASSDHFIALVAAAPFGEWLQLSFVRNQERHRASVEPAAWDHVFAATGSHVALKPVAAAVAAPAVAYYTAPYIATNVSPVVVPAAWYYPYYYPWYLGYYHWAYPYYSVYSAYYYPAWYYAPLWPYYRPPYVPTAPAPAVKTESAEVAPGRAARLVQTTGD
jgi:predicted metalloprotease with PDZ domain